MDRIRHSGPPLEDTRSGASSMLIEKFVYTRRSQEIPLTSLRKWSINPFLFLVSGIRKWRLILKKDIEG